MSSHGNDHQFHIMPTEDHSVELGHVIPFRVYLGVFIGLLCLTAVTVAVSRFNFGAFNLVIAMFIASIKGLMVALFFMHLKYENRFTLAYAAFPLILLSILMGGVFMDNPYRGTVNGPSIIKSYAAGSDLPAKPAGESHEHGH